MHEWSESVEVVGIVGAGVIGASWSALFLDTCKSVDVVDPSPSAEDDVRGYVKRETARRPIQGAQP